MTIAGGQPVPWWGLSLFWGVLFLLIQQAERVCLAPDVMARQPGVPGLLVRTFLAGLGNDLYVAAIGLGLVLLLAALVTGLCVLGGWGGTLPRTELFGRAISGVSLLSAVGLFAVTTADLSYFAYNHQHLDFVFFEYLDELIHAFGQNGPSQAAEQTGAELEDPSKWLSRIGLFWGLLVLFAATWTALFRAALHRHSEALQQGTSAGLTMMLVAAVGVTAAGLTPPPASSLVWEAIDSEAYYSLSQNPVLFAHHPFRDVFLSQLSWSPSALPFRMTEIQADDGVRLASDGERVFAGPDYPFIGTQRHPEAPYFTRPPNIVLLFVEGLDRRYLGRRYTPSGSSRPGDQTASDIRLTPFLDRLKDESLYFPNFFSNGVQTLRGLFATLCSAWPRQGTAVIKTRRTHDFLCMPSVLRQAGYHTEMVVSLDSDLTGLREFLERNGIERYYAEQDFPQQAERLGLGLTDGALLDFIEHRVTALRTEGTPFFLAALTTSTHHPFAVPASHPDVQALTTDPDGYVAALRYFDAELERVFGRMRKNGLLDNTIVLILGDHGRHEAVGESDHERQVGHYMAPLFVWLDESLRRQRGFQAGAVKQVASQVDIAPTVLTAIGLMPRVEPFVGQDLSCVLAGPCRIENRAYLSSVYDDAIGIADETGIWQYSFRRGLLSRTDLDLRTSTRYDIEKGPAGISYLHAMGARYLAWNRALERNRIWSPDGPAVIQ
ncbi:MAG: LTA synthase family protein [Nitrospiraceae bacterium]